MTLLLAIVALESTATACLIAMPPEHTTDPALVGVDTAPPSMPTGLVVQSLSRGVGPVCDGDACATTSCDDLGVLVLGFSPALDDLSTTETIGYQVVHLSGALPDGMSLSDTAWRGEDALTVIWSDGATDAQEPLDFSLGIVAIDEAGNASAPAEVWVSDAGREGAPTGCSAVGGGGLLAALCGGLLAISRRRR